MKFEREFELKLKKGCKIVSNSGEIEYGHPDNMASIPFYFANKGDKIIPVNEEYEYIIALYRAEFDTKYIYTYDYEKNQSWVTYTKNLNLDSYNQSIYNFDEDIYFRINVRRKDGKILEEKEEKNLIEIFHWQKVADKDFELPFYLKEEVRKSVFKVNETRNKDDLVFLILADSHYVVNGTWEYTQKAMELLSNSIEIDGIIHLGDCTDGMLSRDLTYEYVNRILKGLKKISSNLYYVVGNHDTNYFNSNPDFFSNMECGNLYLKSTLPKEVIYDNEECYYYVDFEKHKLRTFFLKSFDFQEELRYGYSDEQLNWLEHNLNKTISDWNTIFFSHVPPIPRLHFWTDYIRNSDKLMKIIKHHNNTSLGKVLGFIHGHNHADFIDLQEGFPIVSIGASKCEFFEDKKPEGSTTYFRKIGETSQELWDIMLIGKSGKTIKFLRFGAGEDRIINK